eukprot:TRINITY_DN45091_c0_g1_i1.p1 TRINITY_DN45091_c0_g1~~TRINITY_DN45091_c0_g1_i1.p1  ORF type:complete len:265 (-),score=30.71 TRINITY_DN45091_c0_g1_i1:468-1262(-)
MLRGRPWPSWRPMLYRFFVALGTTTAALAAQVAPTVTDEAAAASGCAGCVKRTSLPSEAEEVATSQVRHRRSPSKHDSQGLLADVGSAQGARRASLEQRRKELLEQLRQLDEHRRSAEGDGKAIVPPGHSNKSLSSLIDERHLWSFARTLPASLVGLWASSSSSQASASSSATGSSGIIMLDAALLLFMLFLSSLALIMCWCFQISHQIHIPRYVPGEGKLRQALKLAPKHERTSGMMPGHWMLLYGFGPSRVRFCAYLGSGWW